MRRAFLFASLAAAVFAACVADAPTTGSGDDSSGNDGGSDATTSGNDGMADGGSSSDAPSSGPCDPAKAFGTAVALDALNGTNQSQSLRLASDGLSAYYSALSADGSTNFDLLEATRGTLTEDFGSPVEINSLPGSVLASPTITGDSLTLYYSYVLRGSGISAQIEVLTRTSGEEFAHGQPPVSVGFPVDTFGDGGFLAFNVEPFVRQDGSELYFSTDRLQNGKFDIYRAKSAGDAGFSSAALLTELGNAHSARAPMVTPDGLLLYYASMQMPDGGAETNWTIYRASRATTSDTFGSITRVDESALDQDSFPDFMTTDRCTIYFHRQATSGSATSLLYKATKTP